MKHPKDGSFHPSFILKLQTARFRTLGVVKGAPWGEWACFGPDGPKQAADSVCENVL